MMSSFRLKVGTLGTIPSFSTTERETFYGLPGGIGAKIMGAWRKGQVPSYAILAKFVAYLREIIEVNTDAPWKVDNTSLQKYEDVISKIETYIQQVYPHGKPKAVRKLSPEQEELQNILSQVEEWKPKAKMLAKRLVSPEVAITFADSILEDINFGRFGRPLLEMFPSTDDVDYTPSEVRHYSELLDYSSAALSFIIALIMVLGYSPAKAKRLAKVWAQMLA